jgi:hypothetical protein
MDGHATAPPDSCARPALGASTTAAMINSISLRMNERLLIGVA